MHVWPMPVSGKDRAYPTSCMYEYDEELTVFCFHVQWHPINTVSRTGQCMPIASESTVLVGFQVNHCGTLAAPCTIHSKMETGSRPVFEVAKIITSPVPQCTHPVITGRNLLLCYKVTLSLWSTCRQSVSLLLKLTFVPV